MPTPPVEVWSSSQVVFPVFRGLASLTMVAVVEGRFIVDVSSRVVMSPTAEEVVTDVCRSCVVVAGTISVVIAAATRVVVFGSVPVVFWTGVLLVESDMVVGSGVVLVVVSNIVVGSGAVVVVVSDLVVGFGVVLVVVSCTVVGSGVVVVVSCTVVGSIGAVVVVLIDVVVKYCWERVCTSVVKEIVCVVGGSSISQRQTFLSPGALQMFVWPPHCPECSKNAQISVSFMSSTRGKFVHCVPDLHMNVALDRSKPNQALYGTL